jgi:hypothetical protein
MKIISVLAGLAAISLFVVEGCSKSDQTPPAPQVNGVTVDLPKLTEAFANSSQELKSTATQVGFNIRYGKYEDALMSLDKLANDPGTTDAQKKVVNQVINEAKQLANAAPAAAAPTQ